MLGALHVFGAYLKPFNLLCEYRVNPLGIDEPQPRLTWLVASDGRGQKQTGYRVLVSESEDQLKRGIGVLWDSGKVESNQTVNVVYNGRKLVSGQQCCWKVCVWGKEGNPEWSKPACWTMGILEAKDWQADYISYRDLTPIAKDDNKTLLSPARQYRKDFLLAKTIRHATVYATALGIYELYLNGQRVGDAQFAPGWTDYHQRAYYNTYDVTPLLHKGANAIGAWVADGWYSGYVGFAWAAHLGPEKIGRYLYGKTPAFLAQLEVEYSDGSRQVILTDNSWKVTGDGPIREADFQMGEFYDALREMPDWLKPGFDDRNWESAIRAGDNGSAPAMFYESVSFTNFQKKSAFQGREIDLGFKSPVKLESFPGVPVRATQEIKPIAITEPTNGVYIFNLGQNFAGVVRLKVKGSTGTQIRLRYGEMLHPDGSLMTENLRRARATDFYVLRGDRKGETFEPRFTYHGFQYVEVTGLLGKPRLEDLTGVVLNSDTPLTSDFECSDSVINRLFKNIVWTQRANFVDVPTDCPQRDERLGWTGDAQIYIRTATYNADVAAFYTKWLRDLMDSQLPNGTFPGYSPCPFQIETGFGTAWCDAGVICPWTIWRVYGDTRILNRCWPNLVKFMDWRKSTSTNFLGITHGSDWGDWLSVEEKTPLDYIDTVYFAYSAKLMSEMASAIGKESEAISYRELFENIKTAFNQKYVMADGSLTIDSQTAYVLALHMGLLPENLRPAAGKILARRIQAKANADNSGMTTGFLGTGQLLPALSDAGQLDTAGQLFQSLKYPSWGYEVAQGATTIWERWNSYTKEKGFGDASMNSFAHYSFGAVGEWIFSRLAGIDFDDAGGQHIIIRPTPPDSKLELATKPIDWVKAHYDSIHGRIVSNWKLNAGRFELEVTIPANTTATVYLPATPTDVITERGHRLAAGKGVKIKSVAGNCTVLEVGSGNYKFLVSPDKL